MNVAYTSMYKNEKKISLFKNQLAEFDIQKIFIDLPSKGKSKKEFQLMLEMVQPGDRIIIVSLNHLGENYREIRDRVISIHSQKVHLTVINSNFLNFETDNTQFNELGFQLFVNLLEEIPRIKEGWNRERQLLGIQRAKENGVYKGRPTMYSANSKNLKARATYFQVKDMLLSGFPITTIESMTGITRPTIYRIRRELEE
ncbi:hypothetical protein IGL98_000126 [Enterococcus sp. DIV0840]|uniref:Recombinase family protein n=1 Tax=Candidatus Enterococcus ikei TaxID=2815326 RepID=A0ABS3H3W0_9ENTE|nr:MULTISPECIES: recombinase family protein [Enterococcus]MBO0433914.1 recombinase family protein [Enterococcus sp. DIV0849a]MBO0441696.1 recombinase family protein [Enterococcus sp. DIV0869a]MBO0475106.1 recombinase family protein [Enterococcus ureasiticus]